MIDTRGAGVSRLAAPCAPAGASIQTTGGPAVRQPTRRQVAALKERMSGAWGARHAEPETAGAPLEPELERRFAALADRLEHVEATLEGLQDALYRQSVREDER